MARQIDIAISAKDNFSDALRKMKATQTEFRKDLGQLNTELDRLNKNKVDLKMDFSKAREDLRGAEKDFRKFGDEMSRQRVEDAQMNYENIRSNLSLVSKGARQTEKDMARLTEVFSKTQNRAEGAGSSIMAQIGRAGLYNMAGQALSGAAQTYVGSAYGSDAGQIFGGILGGAASGAAIGSIIPGIGTAVGAAVGTAVGAINAGVQHYQKQDDAFKGVVQSEYDRVKADERSSLEAGIAAASERELIAKKGAVVFGGEGESERILGDVMQYALDTPFDYTMMAQQAVNMRTSGVLNDDIMGRLKQIGDLSMGDPAVFGRIALQYTQATAKGKAQTQDLRIIAEAGVPIYEALEAVKNTDRAGIYEMLEAGQVFAKDLNEAFDHLTGQGGRLHGMLENLAGTFPMLMEQRAEIDETLDAAMGAGYADARKKGLEADIDWKSGAMGEKMEEAYRMMGEFQADLENQQEEILRIRLTEAMESGEYLEAIEEGNGAEAGKILAEAKVAAENEYNQSEGYQLMMQTDMALVDGLQADLAGSWYNYGYTMQKKFEEGRAAVPAAQNTPSTTQPGVGTGKAVGGRPTFAGYAYGLTYVPYDNFPALLHQGERVLTKSEAGRTGGGVNITFGDVTVRKESDIDAIAAAIVTKLKFAGEGYVKA